LRPHELRKEYAAHPELYELARERERLHPDLLRSRGNTDDLRQRASLRTHCALRNLTDEFDFSLLSPECYVSLTLASGLSGFCALL